MKFLIDSSSDNNNSNISVRKTVCMYGAVIVMESFLEFTQCIGCFGW